MCALSSSVCGQRYLCALRVLSELLTFQVLLLSLDLIQGQANGLSCLSSSLRELSIHPWGWGRNCLEILVHTVYTGIYVVYTGGQMKVHTVFANTN